MRSFARVLPTFWTGSTGKEIRSLGIECQLVAMYLITSPHATMAGLYHLPIAYLAHDVGLPFEGASKTLRSLSEVGFCRYNEAHEVVFVPEMARIQVGETLKRDDNKRKGILNDVMPHKKCPLIKDFWEKYEAAFYLPACPFEAPSKPLAGGSRARDARPEPEPEPEIEPEEKNPPVGPPLPQNRPSRSASGDAAKATDSVRGDAPREPKRSRRCPQSWSPPPGLYRLAEELGVPDPDQELAAFRDHEFATPRGDWNATARNWLRKAAKMRGGSGGSGVGPHGRTAAEVTMANVRDFLAEDESEETAWIEHRRSVS